MTVAEAKGVCGRALCAESLSEACNSIQGLIVRLEATETAVQVIINSHGDFQETLEEGIARVRKMTAGLYEIAQEGRGNAN